MGLEEKGEEGRDGDGEVYNMKKPSPTQALLRSHAPAQKPVLL